MPHHEASVSFFDDMAEPATSDLDTRVLRLVRQDPFATIADLRRELNRAPNAPLVSWWRIFGVLRRHKLLLKRSRFRYARRRV
ncbi:MAG: hypothetical protein AB1644_02030 [Candidatus Zixiibacteriota bacterium]